MDSSTHITDVLKACSDFTRLRMMRLLLVSGTELCVGELVQSLLGRPYNISKQLKVLEHAGMVERKKQGRHVYYRQGSGKEAVSEMIFRFIEQLPDSDAVFEVDRVRMEEVLNGRELPNLQASAPMPTSSQESGAAGDVDGSLEAPILAEDEVLPSNLL